MGDNNTENKPVMVGCGCKNMKDVVTFIRERKIEYVELAWADEMGLWHNELVHVGELTYANLQEGVQCKDGRFLLPDPLSARIAPLTQPNTMLFTCKPPTSRNAYLKRKELSPGWIEMISKKLMQNDKSPSIPVSRVNDLLEDSVPRTPQHVYARSGPMIIPRSPGEYSNPASPSSALNSSSGSSPRGLGSPGGSPIGSPTTEVPSPSLHANTSGFIDWKLVRSNSTESYGTSPSLNVFPPSPPTSDGNVTPPGSVPGSPCLPGSPRSPVPDSGQEALELQPTEGKGKFQHLVPPLLRPRQIHPTKANKLGITKPVKKRRNTEHLFCRHCGTTETPEWRRGPDGRKSLCNACGLYFSKMIKRETMVVPQGRRVAIDALLNPHS